MTVMMRNAAKTRVIGAIFAIGSIGCGGCVEATKRSAVATAEKECRKDGGTFVMTGKPQVRGGLMGNVVVRGQCHQPGDPGYVAPERGS